MLGSNGQGHNVYVGRRQTERNIAIAAAYVSYAGFSPAAISRRVDSRRPLAAGRWVFQAWVFALL